MPEQHRYSQSGPEVSGSYFLERDYRPLLLGGTRPPGLNSSVTQPTRCRKQVNRHSSDICRWVTVHNLLPGSAASNWWSNFFPKPFNCPPSLSHSLPPLLLSSQPLFSVNTLTHFSDWVNAHTPAHIFNFCTCTHTYHLLYSSDGSRLFQFGGPLLIESCDRFGSPVVAQCGCVMKSLLPYKSQV